MRYSTWLAALLFVGCASPGTYRKPVVQLDKAIRFTEITASGDEFKLSGKGEDVTQVPNGTAVDINSSISIEVDKSAIQLLGAETPPDQATITRLSERRKRLSEALVALAGVVESRLRTLEAYEATRSISFAEMQTSPEFVAFSSAVTLSGDLKNKFAQMTIWVDNTFIEDEVEAAFDDVTFAKVGELLQRELNAAETEFQATIDRANRTAGTLSMEAMLEPTGNGENAPIHLEGYDLFDKKSVALKNSSVMDGDDWKAFERQYAQVVDLANQAERVRTGEIALDQALMQSANESLKKLLEGFAEIRPLVEKDWRDYLLRLQRDLQSVKKASEEVLKRRGEKEVEFLKGRGELLASEAVKSLPLVDAKALADEVKALHHEWRRVSPESLVKLIGRTRDLQEKTENLVAAFARVNVDAITKSFGSVITDLQQRPVGVSEEAWNEIRVEIEKIPALIEAQQTHKKLVSLGSLIKGMPSLLRFSEVQPSRADVRSPKILEVPVAQARDTAIELQRTPRVFNDRISYIATLRSGPATLMETKASFHVREFGWHSVMAPSVILSRQWVAHSSRERDMKFSPAVAWLRKYLPRDTEKGGANATARFFQPGFGLHAAFLDHDPNDDTEVGLGVAASFGNDLLIMGAGLNMMNNSKVYFYVGSNLIPILQKMGFAKDGGAGKKP